MRDYQRNRVTPLGSKCIGILSNRYRFYVHIMSFAVPHGTLPIFQAYRAHRYGLLWWYPRKDNNKQCHPWLSLDPLQGRHDLASTFSAQISSLERSQKARETLAWHIGNARNSSRTNSPRSLTSRVCSRCSTSNKQPTWHCPTLVHKIPSFSYILAVTQICVGKLYSEQQLLQLNEQQVKTTVYIGKQK